MLHMYIYIYIYIYQKLGSNRKAKLLQEKY